MSISDKVITANSVAKQVNIVDAIRFVFSQQGANYFISVNNTNLFLFDNSADCAVWTNSLNSAVISTLSALRSYYDSKVGAILA